jgi:lysozyme
MMIPSVRCEALIKGFEQCRLTAFLPTPQDRPTIGWGHTGPDVRLGMMIDQPRADALFDHDLDLFAVGVDHDLTGCATRQAQFDALVSLAYNIGEGAFMGSTLLGLHRAGDFAGAAAEFLKWDKQHGVALPGLLRRRQAEAALYGSQ